MCGRDRILPDNRGRFLFCHPDRREAPVLTGAKGISRSAATRFRRGRQQCPDSSESRPIRDLSFVSMKAGEESLPRRSGRSARRPTEVGRRDPKTVRGVSEIPGFWNRSVTPAQTCSNLLNNSLQTQVKLTSQKILSKSETASGVMGSNTLMPTYTLAWYDETLRSRCSDESALCGEASPGRAGTETLHSTTTDRRL